MAALLDIRRRIRSVKSTQQITRAMKMVAAARLRRAQDRIFNARPYANQMMALLSSVAARTTDRSHPLLAERPIERQLLVLVTADRGLCGGFNTNLIRAAQIYLDEHRERDISILAVGRKGTGLFRSAAGEDHWRAHQHFWPTGIQPGTADCPAHHRALRARESGRGGFHLQRVQVHHDPAGDGGALSAHQAHCSGRRASR